MCWGEVKGKALLSFTGLVVPVSQSSHMGIGLGWLSSIFFLRYKGVKGKVEEGLCVCVLRVCIKGERVKYKRCWKVRGGCLCLLHDLFVCLYLNGVTTHLILLKAVAYFTCHAFFRLGCQLRQKLSECCEIWHHSTLESEPYPQAQNPRSRLCSSSNRFLASFELRDH